MGLWCPAAAGGGLAALLEEHRRTKKHDAGPREALVAATALLAEAALALVHFFGCVTLQVATKLAPREAALCAAAAYAGALPLGAVVGLFDFLLRIISKSHKEVPEQRNK
ncbi:MAG: hypothetical protein AAFZ92_08010 [Pseudomonadota bacterium]